MVRIGTNKVKFISNVCVLKVGVHKRKKCQEVL